MKIIDCHVHPQAVKNYEEAFEHFIRHMRAHNISAMVASDLADGWPAYPDSETLHRANDRLRKMCEKYKNELFYLVYINPQLADWQEELALHEGSACGVKLWVSLRNPADKEDLSAAVAVIKAAAERSLPVLIHCFERTDGNCGGSVGIDEMICLAGEVPEAVLIAAHSNGNWRKLIAKASRVPENIFFDVSGGYPERTMVRRLVDTFGIKRILFGSDAPGRSFASQLNKVLSADLSSEELNDILYENCRRIFQLPDVAAVSGNQPYKFTLPAASEDNFCFAGKSEFWDHDVSVAELVHEADKHSVDTLYAASLTALKSSDFYKLNREFACECKSYKKIKPLAVVDITDKSQTLLQLNDMAAFAGVWISPYLHSWCLSDKSFGWFFEECSQRKIPVWINTALSDERFKVENLETRLPGGKEISEFAGSAPENKYVLQGLSNLEAFSNALPDNFFLEYSKLSDGEYLAEKFAESGNIRRLCRGSEYPFREFDAVESCLVGKF